MKKKIGELLFQMIPVMLGVYLAFVVSDWGERSKRRSESKVLIDLILLEAEANKKQLEDVIDYHRMVYDSARHYANPNNPVSKPEFFEGVKIFKLAGSAYETGIQTGIINELSLDQNQFLNDLYKDQEYYNDYGTLILSSLINKNFSDKEEDIRNIAQFLVATMSDVVIMERSLIKGYDELGDKLE